MILDLIRPFFLLIDICVLAANPPCFVSSFVALKCALFALKCVLFGQKCTENIGPCFGVFSKSCKGPKIFPMVSKHVSTFLTQKRGEGVKF